MHRTLTRALLGLAACLLACPGLAQEDAEPLRITITAPAGEEQWRDTPASVTVVDEEVLAGGQRLSLNEGLQRVPGVFAQNRFNFAQGLRLSIRGFGARASFGVRGIRVLVDGVPLTLPDGQTELDALDLALVEQIEVIRGPASVIHGNAAGGVVAIETREPPEQLGARLDLSGGELGFRRARAEGGGSLGAWRGLAAVNATRLEGFRDLNDTDADIFTGKLARSFAAGDLTLRLNAIDTEAEDPGALTEAQVDADRSQAAPGNLQFDAGEAIDQQRLALIWRGAPQEQRDYRVTAYAGQRDFANRLPFTAGGQVAFDRSFGGADARYTRRGAWLNLDQAISAGFRFEAQRDERSRFDNNNGVRGARTLRQDEEALTWGVFVQDDITLSPLWSASLGLRYDRVRLSVDDEFLADGDDSGERDLDDVSFSAGLGYRLNPADQVYARVASSFETPTINELANPAGGGFNPDLESAEAVNYELGIKGERSAFRYEAAVFSIRIDDELIPFELPGQSGRTFFRNAGESRRNGVELAVDWQFLPRWNLHAAYTYADYEFERFSRDGMDFSGNEIPGIPRQQFFGELAYERSFGEIDGYARLNVNAFDRYFTDDANDVRVPGYAVVNLRLGFKQTISNFEIEPYVGIDNLLDKEYNDNVRINAFGGRFFEPAPARFVYAGLRARL